MIGGKPNQAYYFYGYAGKCLEGNNLVNKNLAVFYFIQNFRRWLIIHGPSWSSALYSKLYRKHEWLDISHEHNVEA